jgi:hypothetical protein
MWPVIKSVRTAIADLTNARIWLLAAALIFLGPIGRSAMALN